MITYHRQNKFQKELTRLIGVFRIDLTRIRQLQENGIETYNLGATKREKLGVGLIVFSLIVPMTATPISVPALYKIFLGGRR